MQLRLFKMETLHNNAIKPPPPGGGGYLPLEAVPDAREKIPGKRVSKSGVGALRALRVTGVKSANIGKKGIQIEYHQSCGHAIKPGKGR